MISEESELSFLVQSVHKEIALSFGSRTELGFIIEEVVIEYCIKISPASDLRNVGGTKDERKAQMGFYRKLYSSMTPTTI